MLSNLSRNLSIHCEPVASFAPETLFVNTKTGVDDRLQFREILLFEKIEYSEDSYLIECWW